MKIVRTLVIPAAIILVALLIAVFLFSLKKDPPRRPPVEQVKIVETLVADLRPRQSDIELYGRLRSAQPLTLNSEVSGNLEKGDIPFRPGQSFRKGQLIVKIDDRQSTYDLNSAKSDFLNALAAVLPEIKVDFPDEFEKYQNYFNICGFDKKLPELPETTDQKIKLYLTRFNVYKLYYSVRNLEVRQEKHYFYAPFDGVILSADLRIGAIVRGGNRLGEILNLEDMEVEVPIPVADLRNIDRDRPVNLISKELHREWRGEIRRIGKNIDDRTQSVPAFISLSGPRDSDLIDGLFLKVILAGRRVDNAYLIPRKAVYEDNYIYRIKGGRLKYTRMQPVRVGTDSVLCTGGVATGDTLVSELMLGVSDGMAAVSSDAVGTAEAEANE